MTADGSKERTKEQTKERTKAFDLALGQLEKQFGKGSIIRLGDGRAVQDLAVIPTGSLGLDLALGLGGLPRGRVIEIFGPESSGKTTLTLSVIAEAQKLGGNAVFIDAEHALQPSYAKLLGVDIDNLYVSQPDTGEEALEIADQLVRSGAVDVVVIDSVAALVPRAEIEGEMGDSHVGLQARLMSQALRKLTGSISKSQCMVIFINQIRMKIGVMFGNPETTSGGNALKFYASVRLDIRRTGSIKEGEEVTGSRTKVRVVKNKVAAPFRAAEFDIMYKEGISHNGELIDLGIDAGLVQKSGTWLSYGDQRLGQGRENARQTLKENPEMARQLEGQIRATAGLPMLAAPAGAAAAGTAEAGGADARGTDGKKSKGDTSGSRWKAGDETISSTLVAAGESVEDGAETASAVRERRGGPKKS